MRSQPFRADSPQGHRGTREPLTALALACFGAACSTLGSSAVSAEQREAARQRFSQPPPLTVPDPSLALRPASEQILDRIAAQRVPNLQRITGITISRPALQPDQSSFSFRVEFDPDGRQGLFRGRSYEAPDPTAESVPYGPEYLGSYLCRDGLFITGEPATVLTMEFDSSLVTGRIEISAPTHTATALRADLLRGQTPLAVKASFHPTTLGRLLGVYDVGMARPILGSYCIPPGSGLAGPGDQSLATAILKNADAFSDPASWEAAKLAFPAHGVTEVGFSFRASQDSASPVCQPWIPVSGERWQQQVITCDAPLGTARIVGVQQEGLVVCDANAILAMNAKAPPHRVLPWSKFHQTLPFAPRETHAHVWSVGSQSTLRRIESWDGATAIPPDVQSAFDAFLLGLGAAETAVGLPSGALVVRVRHASPPSQNSAAQTFAALRPFGTVDWVIPDEDDPMRRLLRISEESARHTEALLRALGMEPEAKEPVVNDLWRRKGETAGYRAICAMLFCHSPLRNEIERLLAEPLGEFRKLLLEYRQQPVPVARGQDFLQEIELATFLLLDSRRNADLAARLRTFSGDDATLLASAQKSLATAFPDQSAR